MLKKIRLKDFKSFVDEEIELAPLTLLVGANASGKSNFLDALRFLQGIYIGLPVRDVLNGEESSRPDAWPGLRGRAQEAARLGTSAFTLDSRWQEDPMEPEPEHLHSISCRTEPVSLLADEMFVGKALKAEIVFLKIDPDRMRGYGHRGAPLGDEGRNVSGVLADLCENPADKKSLVDWLTELCAPELEDIDFAEVKELGDVMAIFVEKEGRRISARSISDGTLRFLGTLLALRTAKPDSIILIEEVEAGLHPTRIRLLVEYLEAATRDRGIQVIATTHSPVVLQWLSDESLRNVIAFGRVPDHDGTLMRRLGGLPHFDEAVARAGIEELFTTGWLEMAL